MKNFEENIEYRKVNQKTKILVTGATGFIGSNLIKKLQKDDYNVICVGTDKKNKLNGLCKKFIKTPFYEPNWNLIGNIDILFHQAAISNTTFNDEQKMIFVNSKAPIKLFREVISHGCKKIVYASSTAVYGNTSAPFIEGRGEKPLNVYGKSKLILDKNAMNLAKKHPNVIIVGLRYCNVFGPGESHKGKAANMIYQLAQQILNDRPRIFRYGEQKRDQIYVKDVIRANLCTLNAKESCVVNCGSGEPITFNEMIEVLNKVLGKNKKIIYIKNPYPFFQNHTECDMKKAKEKIGFVPKFSFREGIEDYYKSGKLTEPPVY